MLVHPLLFDQPWVLYTFVQFGLYFLFVHNVSSIIMTCAEKIALYPPVVKLTWPRKSLFPSMNCITIIFNCFIVVGLSECIGLHISQKIQKSKSTEINQINPFGVAILWPLCPFHSELEFAPSWCTFQRCPHVVMLWRKAKRPPSIPRRAIPSLSEVGEVIPKFPEISCTCHRHFLYCDVLFGAWQPSPTGNLSSRRPCIISSCSNSAAWTFPVKISDISATLHEINLLGQVERLARLEVEDMPSTGNFGLQKVCYGPLIMFHILAHPCTSTHPLLMHWF